MKRKNGFTLVELLAVVVILGILSSIAIISVNKVNEKQKEVTKENIVSGILTGARKYFAENPNASSVNVYTLKSKDFVDFDDSKVDDNIKNAEVNYTECDSNNIKRALYVEVNSIKYNDCGCSNQDGANGAKLCSGDKGTAEATIK